MKLSIIVPVYNEAKTVEKIIKKLEDLRLEGIGKEIIVVDDFSTDGTRETLNKSKKHKIFYHNKNMGKGKAVRTGLENATGDIITIQDADLEYDPNDYIRLIQPILDGKSSVVYGSRFLNTKLILVGKDKTKMPSHYIGNTILNLILRVIYRKKVTDMETCYKVFSKDVIKNIKLRANRFEIEPEITAKILKKGYTIYELPITFNPRDFKKGKKITWRDGIRALACLIKYRFVE